MPVHGNLNNIKKFKCFYYFGINVYLVYFILGTSILKLKANDTDDPTTANGQLEYQITEGNVGGKFRIDKNTAEIFVQSGATFDYDSRKRYEMKVNVLLLLKLFYTPTPSTMGDYIVQSNFVGSNSRVS